MSELSDVLTKLSVKTGDILIYRGDTIDLGDIYDVAKSVGAECSIIRLEPGDSLEKIPRDVLESVLRDTPK